MKLYNGESLSVEESLQLCQVSVLQTFADLFGKMSQEEFPLSEEKSFLLFKYVALKNYLENFETVAFNCTDKDYYAAELAVFEQRKKKMLPEYEELRKIFEGVQNA